MRINNKTGHLEDWITQVWVKITGIRFDPGKDDWLMGPVGNTEIIKDLFIQKLAEKEDLEFSKTRRTSVFWRPLTI